VTQLCLSLGRLFLAALTVSCASQAPSQLPNGTYTYVICDGGCRKDSATSTFVVSRSDGTVVIEEHDSPMEPDQSTRRILDAKTYLTQSFAAYSAGKSEYVVTITGSSATLQEGSEKPAQRTVAASAAPFVVTDPFSVGVFFHLPATLHATGATHVTLASVGTEFKAEVLSVSSNVANRPTTVPEHDVGISITMSPSANEGRTGTLWYDPQTFALDEFDMPALRLVMRRIANPSATAALPTRINSSGPLGIAVGPDGNLWFSESSAGRIGRITTAGAITEFSKGLSDDSSPQGVAKSPEDYLWFADQSGNRIGRITPAGVITQFQMGAATGPAEVAVGSDRNLWFTENQGNQIGRITAAGAISEFSKGLEVISHPAGIAAGPDGNVWFTDDGSNRIGRITSAGGITEFSTGLSTNSGVLGIAAGPDGNLWFAENRGNRIGRITTSGAITEFSAGLSPDSAPFGIASAGGYLWFTEQLGNRIGRISPTGTITEFSTGLSANSLPEGITSGPDGNVWFTEYEGNQIGRITPSGAITEFSKGLSASNR
jgi:streptogramin lyase